MSIIETLTEGIVNRDMKKEGSALLNKWGKTGLLEGLQNEHQKSTMARLLENQAKELLRESSAMAGSPGDVEGFAAVAFPIVRRVFAGLIANELVSVQPMSLPSGLIFFLDFTFGSSIGDSTAETYGGRFGNDAAASVYGTDRVASEVTGGVNLVGSTLKETLSGAREAVGYAYASPTASVDITAANATMNGFAVSGISDANKKKIRYDADLLSDTSLFIVEYLADATGLAQLTALDTDNLSALVAEVDNADNTDMVAIMAGINAGSVTVTATNFKQVRRLTKIEGGVLKFYFATSVDISSIAAGEAADGSDLTVEYPKKDTVAAGTAAAGALNAYGIAMKGIEEIPEIDIKVDSIAITAQSKKLKAKWTPELGQDLNAYHNLDAEVELTSILSEQIALEIDREILADLVNGATAGTQYWSRSPGLFVNRSTGLEIGANSAAPDFTGTVSEWYETLIETINDVSAQIHRKTLRGGANFVIVSPEVANVLEFTSGFRANVTADADKGEIGAVKVGSLSRKFDVIVDPYFPRNVILVGRKGNSFLESGYVYAPYVPLQTTPTIFDPESFVPRKGVMTRYAKKMVRPDMYGLVIVRDLLGGEYSS